MLWRRRRTDKGRSPEREAELACVREQLRDAEHELAEVQERTSEIREISRTLRRLREQNRFAPLVWEAFGGGDAR